MSLPPPVELPAHPSQALPAPGQAGAAPVAGTADWSDSQLSSGFSSGLVTATGAGSPRPVFDLCHVGVVLRAVLFMELVLALGLLFEADEPGAVLLPLALASATALPGLLLWLALACALRQGLAALGTRGQWLAAGVLGAACAALGRGLMQWAGGGLLTPGPWLAPVFSGAFLGVLLMVWLQLRHRSQLPADTTARLAELQSRIRPHFLFNTLNSALSLVRRDPDRAEALLEDLAELFRSALADGASVVSLGEEIDLAQRYLAIEQVRFGERLKVVWQLDPAANGARVPPLLLQPLVENAVRHGIEPHPLGGTVRVSTRIKRGQVWVSVLNTLPAEPGAGAAGGHGIALQNVRDRLSLMHDVSASLQVRTDGRTYQVLITLPL
jgi:two-component system, LytTR family, sensor histidine kinase AlgZ